MSCLFDVGSIGLYENGCTARSVDPLDDISCVKFCRHIRRFVSAEQMPIARRSDRVHPVLSGG